MEAEQKRVSELIFEEVKDCYPISNAITQAEDLFCLKLESFCSC